MFKKNTFNVSFFKNNFLYVYAYILFYSYV